MQVLYAGALLMLAVVVKGMNDPDNPGGAKPITVPRPTKNPPKEGGDAGSPAAALSGSIPITPLSRELSSKDTTLLGGKKVRKLRGSLSSNRIEEGVDEREADAGEDIANPPSTLKTEATTETEATGTTAGKVVLEDTTGR